MTATIGAKEHFLENLESHFQENLKGVSPLLQSIRRRAWEHFLELGLPEKKQEAFQYLPLNQLYLESFDLSRRTHLAKEMLKPLIFPECRRRVIVFENGQYAPDLSDTSALPEEVVIMPLRDSLSSYGSFLQGRLVKTLAEETDPFATLNIALIQLGLFVYVPPRVTIDEPIQCLHIATEDRPAIFSPRIYFFVGSKAKVNWINSVHFERDMDCLSNGVIDISLEDGATFNQTDLINPCTSGWYFQSVRATLKKESELKTTSYTSGAKLMRQDFRIALVGENAKADLKGVSYLRDNLHSHVNVLVHHHAPHCESWQSFKNVLDDHSRASFIGKIMVDSKAQKTNAYQLNNNLLLSDKAICNSKPGLEIFADDVKASHGATFTQLKKDQLHYLKTRGLCRSEAQKLLISGFCMDILGSIPYLSVREKLQKQIERRV